MSKYHGHKTLGDGAHVPLTPDDAEALWAACEEADAKSANDMPTTADALRALQDARERLRKLGWRDGIYCPKDGTPFAVIQYGSTGIFEAFYSGEWPSGFVYCCDGVEHPEGLLFKMINDLTKPERVKMDECMESERSHAERTIQSLIASDQDQSN